MWEVIFMSLHTIVSTVGETSSAAAKYLIQVLIDQNLERENIILLAMCTLYSIIIQLC